MNIMVDFETLSADTRLPALLSCGVVIFSDTKIIEEHYFPIDLDSCIRMGANISADTISWWMKQSDEARKVFSEKGQHIDHFLKAILSLFSLNDKNIKPWGNGSIFDIVILENYLKASNYDIPWKYYNVRDTRTLFDAADFVPPKFVGKHNALEDARAQANNVIFCLNKIKGK